MRETVPGMVVLWLTRAIWQPDIKFVPDIVTGVELVLYPEIGETVVIVGNLALYREYILLCC